MDALAEAIVYACAYLSIMNDSEERIHQDIGALESIGATLSAATEQERAALRVAVARAIAGESALAEPRPEFLQAYEDFAATVLDTEAA